MRGGPDQAHGAVLDVRQKRVLLGLVEAVDFIDEKQRRRPGVGQAVGGRGQDPAHVRDIGLHTAQALKPAPGLIGDDLCQAGLAGARRAKENQRLDAVRLDGATQQLARRENMPLAHVLGQGARTHPGGQGLMLVALRRFFTRIIL